MAKSASEKLAESYFQNDAEEQFLKVSLDDLQSSKTNVVEIDIENVSIDTTRLLLEKDAQASTATDFHALCSRFTPLPCEQGQVIVEQGNPSQFVYVLTEGRCKVTRGTENELHDMELKELVAGQSFGEEALVDSAERQTTVTMETDGTVLMLSKDEYVELLHELSLTIVSQNSADVIVANGGRWLDVGSTMIHGDKRRTDVVQIPMKFLRHKSMVLNPDRHYVITAAHLNHSLAAAQVLQQCGFQVSVVENHSVN